MGLIEDGEQWLFKVAAKKAVIKTVSFVVAWIASGIVQGYLTKFGVTYDPVTLQAALTGAALTGLKMLEDYINLKYGTNI